jgi:hypothetical protein
MLRYRAHRNRESLALAQGANPLADDEAAAKRQSLTRTVLADPHFWIPVLVLLGGLAVLRWIS